MDGVFIHIDRTDPNVLVVSLSGELDHSCRQDLVDVIDSFTRSTKDNVRVDLRHVERITVGCCAAFLVLQGLAEERNGQCTLVAPTRPVRRVLELAQVAPPCQVVPSGRHLHLVEPATVRRKEA